MSTIDFKTLPNEILFKINHVRKYPNLAISSVLDRLNYFKDFEFSSPDYAKVKTSEGSEAVLECVDFLRVQTALPEVELHERLSKAAYRHATSFCYNSNLGSLYQGTSDATPEQRIAKIVSWKNMAGECLNIGNFKATDIIISLLIDDGMDERPNRLTLLHKEAKYVGIACVPNKVFQIITVIYLIGGEYEDY